MKNNFGAWFAGFVFALGLGFAGMTQPQKVFGFLNVFGHWDPSLMFVMAGSILVHFFMYKIIRRRTAPLFSKQWHVSEKTKITPSLVIGSIIFGVGWGLGGYCPGPAVVALGSFQWRPLLFLGGLLFGSFIFKKLNEQMKFNR